MRSAPRHRSRPLQVPLSNHAGVQVRGSHDGGLAASRWKGACPRYSRFRAVEVGEQGAGAGPVVLGPGRAFSTIRPETRLPPVDGCRCGDTVCGRGKAPGRIEMNQDQTIVDQCQSGDCPRDARHASGLCFGHRVMRARIAAESRGEERFWRGTSASLICQACRRPR